MNLVLEIYPMVPYNKMSVLRVCCFCPVMGIQILFQSGRGLKVPPQHTHSHLVEAKLCLGWECFWDSEGWNVLGQKETPYSFLHYWEWQRKIESWVWPLCDPSLFFLNSTNIYWCLLCVPFPTPGTVGSDRGELGGSLPSRCSLSDAGRYRHIIMV